jgi:hypothetical protein
MPMFYYNWYASIAFTWMAENFMTPRWSVEQAKASIESRYQTS